MRLLSTKELRLAYRQMLIPAGAFPDPRNSEAGEAYYYESGGRFCAVAFVGASGKPAFRYRFSTDKARAQKVYEFFEGLKARAKYRAEQKVSQRNPHDVKVGDIFRASWGYDQTNIDYYEVLSLIGNTMALVQEIQQEAEETNWLQGECVPRPGIPATEADYSEEGKAYHAQHGHYPRKAKAPFKVRIQGGKAPYFRVASYCSAYRIAPVATVGGKAVYAASHWTSYH